MGNEGTWHLRVLEWATLFSSERERLARDLDKYLLLSRERGGIKCEVVAVTHFSGQVYSFI